MSTNSTIVLKLHPEDVGRIKKCNLTKCKVKKRKTFRYEELPSMDNISRAVKGVKLKNYIEIYHHWDGYPDTLGKWLQKHYTKYEDVLNLLLIGSCSTIIGGVIPYVGFYVGSNNVEVPENEAEVWAKEKWDEVKPGTFNDIPEASRQYQYIAIPDHKNPDNVIWCWRKDVTWHSLKTGKFVKI